VLIQGDITVAIGKISVPSSPEGNDNVLNSRVARAVSKTHKAMELIERKGFKVMYYLHVEIDQANNLGRSDSYGLSDPFVVVKLNGVPFARTSTKSNTSSPRWFDACFEVPVFKRISEPIVSFEVWDMDSDGVGDFLGEAHFNVNNNEFGLKLYPDTETCYLSTLTLDLKEGLHRPEVPSFFEDPKIALHKTLPLARITPRRSPSRRSIVEGSVEKPSQEDIESSKEIILMSAFVIVAYLLVTWGFFSFWSNEKLATIDSFYFAVCTFTTIGYGDMHPITDEGKIFSIFHAFCGVMMIGSGFTVLLKQFVQKELAAVEQTQKAASDLLVGSLLPSEEDLPKDSQLQGDSTKTVDDDSSDDDISTAKGAAKMKARMHAKSQTQITDEEDREDRETELRAHSVKLTMMWFISILTFVAGGLAMGYQESWSALDSIYWVVITATSVGYGDIYPETDPGKYICMFFCPFAVGLMSASIGQTVQFFFEKRATDQASKLFLHDFALDDLIHIEAKDTDKVTRAEFLSFMLIMMKKVDNGLMKRLNNQFDALDADGNGYLEPQDIEIITKKKVDMRRAALSKYHAFNSKFKEFKGDDFARTRQSNRIQYRELSLQRRRSASPTNTPSKEGGSIELKQIDLSPPVKDVEEGLYFFDASP